MRRHFPIAGCLLAAIAAAALAAEEYIRDRWRAEDGFPGGTVYAISQSADGYLWIGAEKGLIRFDGVTFRLFREEGDVLAPGPILGLSADGEGNLWIRSEQPALVLYRNGAFAKAPPESRAQASSPRWPAGGTATSFWGIWKG